MTIGPVRLDVSVGYAVPRAGLPSAVSFRKWIAAALANRIREADLAVRIVGAREGRALNRHYRGKDYATNVLAFVYDDQGTVSGDIVLCAPVLRQEAKAQGKPLADHCAHLVVHGMLHLQGYEHDTVRAARAMEARETAILDRLGVPDPYTEDNAAAARS